MIIFRIANSTIEPIATNQLDQGTRGSQRGSPSDQFPKANTDEWRQNSQFKIWQAGCLWGDVQPVYPVGFDNPAYSKFSMLLSAAETGELELEVKKPDEKLNFSV